MTFNSFLCFINRIMHHANHIRATRHGEVTARPLRASAMPIWRAHAAAAGANCGLPMSSIANSRALIYMYLTVIPRIFRKFADDMTTKTEAIVLHSIKYGDSKLVVDMFTRECGRVQFFVNIPKKPNARIKKQYFQPLTQLAIESDIRPRLQLQRLKDAAMTYPYATLSADCRKLAIAMFAAEFLCHALRGEQQGGALFDYVADSLRWLDASTAGFANFHLVFLMRLSRLLGFRPNLEGYAPGCCFDLRGGGFCPAAPLHHDYLDPRESSLVGLMMRMDFANMHLFRMSRDERNRLAEILISYYRIHIPNFPAMKSLAVLRDLFD